MPLGAHSPTATGGPCRGPPGAHGSSARSPLPTDAARGPGTRVGTVHGGVRGGPGVAMVPPGQGVHVHKEGSGRFGVAPASPRSSLWLMAEFEETLKYDNHHPCCVLLNSAFLMPRANLWAPRGDNSQCHPLPPSPCGKEPLPPACGHASTTPCPPTPAHTATPQGSSTAPTAAEAAPGRRFWQQVCPLALPPPAPGTAPRGDIQSCSPHTRCSCWAPALPPSHTDPQQTPRHNSGGTAAGDSARPVRGQPR